MNSLCEHWQAWVPGRFSFFTLSLQEQGFRGRNNPRASQDLCKSSYTPASITTSLQAFIFSLLMVPQVTKQSIEWVPLVGDWREAAASKTHGEDLTTCSNSLHPPCVTSSCESAPLPCWSMIKNAPSCSLSMIFINFVDLDRKTLLFSPFFLLHLAVCVFVQGESVPPSTMVKHKTLLRVSTKK